jgi:hypothetical protein
MEWPRLPCYQLCPLSLLLCPFCSFVAISMLLDPSLDRVSQPHDGMGAPTRGIACNTPVLSLHFALALYEHENHSFIHDHEHVNGILNVA